MTVPASAYRPPLCPTWAQQAHLAVSPPAEPPAPEAEWLPALCNVEALAVDGDRPWTLVGIVGALALFVAAVAAALAGWREEIAYALGFGSLLSIVAGLWQTTRIERQRDAAARLIFQDTPPAALARATVSQQFSERTRIAIVNYLNQHYAGWSANLDAADAAWADLRHARGPQRACGTGCGGGCR